MPVQQERKQSLRDELTKEHVAPAVDAPSTKAPKVLQSQANPQTVQQSDKAPQLLSIIAQDKPTFLSQTDSKEKQKRDDALAKGMKAFKEDDSTLTEKTKKLQALVYAMRDDEDGLGIKYVRHDDLTKPKTAEEVYKSKEGDCDDLSRLFVVLAQEQLGITNLSQFYVTFRNETTGKEEGHAALFYVGGEVLYIDPGFEKAYVIHTKSKSIEEAIKDPEFRKDLEKCQFEATGKNDNWSVIDVKTISGPNSVEAVYCFEMGVHLFKTDDLGNAERYMQAAIEGGMNSFYAYFMLGEIQYFSKDYATASRSLEVASKMTEDADCYAFLGLSYLRQEKPEYELAATAFRKQVKLEPDNYDAKYNLASSCKNVGDEMMDSHQYKKALTFYTEAEKTLKEIRNSREDGKVEIENALKEIESMKAKATRELSR